MWAPEYYIHKMGRPGKKQMWDNGWPGCLVLENTGITAFREMKIRALVRDWSHLEIVWGHRSEVGVIRSQGCHLRYRGHTGRVRSRRAHWL
jgi:hypothetical protein